MSQRLFLDIGAHNGETLEEAVKLHWHFDKIVCFEPASSCWPMIERLADGRVGLERFGLWDRDASLELHDPGAIGASLSIEKALTETVEVCEVRDAADWFAQNVCAADRVYVKINVEGAECDIVERLIDTGEISKIDHLMLHFDVRKIPSQAHRAAEVEASLNRVGIDWIDARSIMFGRNHALKTANWLAYCDARAAERLRLRLAVRLAFRARQVAYRLRNRYLHTQTRAEIAQRRCSQDGREPMFKGCAIAAVGWYRALRGR